MELPVNSAPAVPAPPARPVGIDTGLLLVIQRCVEGVDGRPRDLDRGQHGVEPLLDGLQPSGRAGQEILWARCRHRFRGLGVRRAQHNERRTLRLIRADQALDAIQAPFGEADGARVAHHATAAPAHHARPHHQAGTPAVTALTARAIEGATLGRRVYCPDPGPACWAMTGAPSINPATAIAAMVSLFMTVPPTYGLNIQKTVCVFGERTLRQVNQRPSSLLTRSRASASRWRRAA